MRFRCSFITLAAIVAVIIAPSIVDAAVQVYTDGPTGFGIAWPINGNGGEVSDSFSVLNATTLTSAQVGLWVAVNNVPDALDWAVGTAPYGSDISSGTLTPLTNISHITGGWDFYQSAFVLSGSLAPATTYYLTLSNGMTTQGGTMSWDVCGGPSVCYLSGEYIYTDSAGEDFSLYGNPGNAAPEPTTLTIWALLGLAGVFVCLRRCRAKA